MIDYSDHRPNPDELLALLKQEEEQEKRGKLKIFFGMCAGVGKTFTMLQAARVDKSKDKDIVIGYVEPHNRKETNDLIEGFEVIPCKQFEYKDSILNEVDIDAIIARKPQIVLIDEFAHTNATGSRHAKRYQDVMDILDNGIDVYTTMNVQHIESRSDTVAQITGIVIRETLPDEIFEKADEVELVDITPDELIQRLNEGKIYAPERSREAINNFFRKGNITALREMALRIVADRVDKQLRQYMQQKRISGPWKSGLHLMVIIGPSLQAARLLRWAKNLSSTMGATLMALYIETPNGLKPEQQDQLSKNINLAKQLGAEFITTSGDDLVRAILNVAQKENITHIVVGKPRHRSFLSLLRLGNFINRLVRYSGNIDVYVLGSDVANDNQYMRYTANRSFTSGIKQYFIAGIFTVLTIIVCYLLKDFISYQIVSFALLFVVSLLAIFLGIGPILLAATLSALLWDYLFIPPAYTLHVEKPVDFLMLLMFFIIALLNGILTSRVRRQERITRDREERTNALYQLTKNLSLISGIDEVLRVSMKSIKKHFQFDCAFVLTTGNNDLESEVRHETDIKLTKQELSVAMWTFRHSMKSGKFTDTLPSTQYTFYPLTGSKMNLGVVAVKQDKSFTGDNEHYWDTFRTQISNALERENLNDIAHKAFMLDESDKLYKTLFNSISHELRIPVATIMGASDTLSSVDCSSETANRLYNEIFTASARLNRLIENLLGMSRLESGHISPRLNWHDVHDLVNKVVDTLKDELKNYNLDIVIPDDMPLVKIDYGLMEQVLYNLLFNATQYVPHQRTLRIKMYYDNNNFIMQVMDRGPGFPPNVLPFVFNKFFRVDGSKTGGTGLGLSIVKGFVEAHNGTVTLENRQNGGAKFTVKIPSEIPEIKTEL